MSQNITNLNRSRGALQAKLTKMQGILDENFDENSQDSVFILKQQLDKLTKIKSSLDELQNEYCALPADVELGDALERLEELDSIADKIEDLKTLQDNAVRTKLILIKMDVNVPEEVEVARQIVAANVEDEGLHLLINNSGIFEILPFEHITAENIEKHFKTNTVGPMMLSKVMQPFLEKAASKNDGSTVAILSISALLGSITSTGSNTFDLNVPSYKISKAALNMAMKILATALKDKGILVTMINPGWVKTDMGNKDLAELTPEESISAMLKTLEQLNSHHHGAFIDRFGKTIPF